MLRFFIPMTLLYASYGLVLGFVQGGVGPVLVSGGLPVELAGFSAILFLPMGLAFLWSPFIERWRIAGLPRATGWIVVSQTLAFLLLMVVAIGEDWNLGVLLVLGLGITIAMATMDVQFEGLVVQRVPDGLRSTAAAVKLATFTLGAVSGGGLLVGLFERIGWQGTFLSMAAFLAVSVAFLKLLPVQPSRELTSPPVNLGAIVRRPVFLRRLVSIAAFLAACFLLFGLNRVALVDIGVPLETVGWLVGTVAPLMGLPVIALSGALARRIGSGRTLLLFLSAGAACGVAWSVAAAVQSTTLAVGFTIVGASVLAGAYVVLLGALLKWSAGERPATDYAIFYGLGNLSAMVPMAGAGFLAAQVGWSAYYLIATCALLAAGSVFYKALAAKPD
ncbi:major facilitator superfamily protein [Nitratireductor aquibiodomus RA22]|uniref:Major facilitator superfamily protein n=1 Tax=Nitratireductor aquibiodomus RA22 TaxID=1189611 RepID=I5BVD6_9HYPH|nr:MFS transporter [Nitratireductor aquibiodomus]EIM73538.1 major facilitator superfamily protein [Nitratireductor aquibiodomus RA22]